MSKKKSKPRIAPFESRLQLSAMLDFDLNNHRFGAYLLGGPRPGKSKKSDPFQLVFGFSSPGIHTGLTPEALEIACNHLSEGLKSLPLRETLTLRFVSESHYTARHRQLETLIASAPSPELKFLLEGERQRGQTLSDKGLREPKSLTLYCTYTPAITGEKRDWWETIMAWAEKRYLNFRGEQSDTEIAQVLTHAYSSGFLLWLNFLEEQLKLTVRPLSAAALWQDAFDRFNAHTACPPIPQLLTITDTDITETLTSDWDCNSLLCLEDLPVCDRKWFWAKERYSSALVFHEKPSGWATTKQQLHYLWNVIAKDLSRDTEIVCTLQAGNPLIIEDSVRRLSKQTNALARKADRRGTLNTAAQYATEQAQEAERSLLGGCKPVLVALTFLVHRPSIGELEQACNYLQQLFSQPAVVLREEHVAYNHWFDGMPITANRLLLSATGDRRLTFTTDEVPGMAPFVSTESRDQQGLELIAECGTPVFVDIFSQPKNLGVFGTTRSGKSVLVSRIILESLAEGMPIVAMDYPKPDGSSTFTDLTAFVNGSYIDIGKSRINLFELPDLRGLPEELQRERFEDYRDFLKQSVLTMVVTGYEEPTLKNKIIAIINIALSGFLRRADIQARYQRAQEDGFGSDAWEQMPTLRDFRAQFDNDPSLTSNHTAEDAIGMIRLQLDSWLNSRVGNAISHPSTVELDNPLVVFALRNLGNNDEAAILSLNALGCSLRRTLAHPRSIFFIDESPILFEFPAISSLVGRLFANGAKSGIRTILSAQDPNTIGVSEAGAKIFQNMPVRLIGRLIKGAPEGFEAHMGYPQSLLLPNTDEKFYPKRSGVYSRWFLDDGGRYSVCRFYPGFRLLGAVANNQEEQQARDAYLAAYADKFEAFERFGEALVTSIQQDQDIAEPQALVGTSS